MAGMIRRFSRRLTRIAAWLSQGVNTVFLGGHQNRTVSARAHLAAQRGNKLAIEVRGAINGVFFWQDDHCALSHQRDVEFAEEVYRDWDVRKTRGL